MQSILNEKDKMIKEGYLDPDNKIYDYGTTSISGNEIVDKNHTGMSFYDQFISGNKKDQEYLHDYKNLKGDVVIMSPTEYFEICATKIFNSSVDKLKRDRELDTNTIEKLKTVLQIYKRKLCMPMINYADKGQEGLHRMLVIGDLYGWDYKVPVLVIDWYDKDRANENEYDRLIAKIESLLEKAVKETLKYYYFDEDLSDFKLQLDNEIDTAFEYCDEVDHPVKYGFEEIGNGNVRVHIGPAEVTFNKNEDIHWKQHDVDEDDLEDIDLDDLDSSDKDLLRSLFGDDWERTFDGSIHESVNNIYSSIIVNPEDDVELANSLNSVVRNFKSSILMKRDNCGPINWELYDLLKKNNFEPRMIHGHYKVDDLSIVDKNDLTKTERAECINQFGDTSKSSVKQYILNNFSEDKINDFYIYPHMYLKVNNLILDAASKMFSNYVNENNKNRYS